MVSPTKYIYNDGIAGITFKNGEEIFVDISVLKNALKLTNAKIDLIDNSVSELFSILGMRNLSAFVGEIFARALEQAAKGLFIRNPHQDGYPDLLAMTKSGRAAWKNLGNNLRDKKPFSPYITGGIEVKATCGSVPTPAVFSRRGIQKPDLGDNRIDFLVGYDWKAHHRLTNNLLGILWDFIDKKPTIVALFYSSDLTDVDWGKIVQPRVGGGRTTSVSIMTRPGILKMYEGWVAVISDKRYLKFINKFNKLNTIAMRTKAGAFPVPNPKDIE